MLDGPLFDLVPASLWIDDFSPLMRRLDALRQDGVHDIERYFAEHPAFLYEAIGLIRAKKVNGASVRMFEASSEQELITRLPELFTLDTLPVFQAEICALFRGERSFEAEIAGQTLGRRRLDLLLQLAVPGDPPDHSNVLFSLVDITERRSAERAAHNLWDHAPEGYATVHPRTRTVLAANATLGTMLGVSPASVVGRPITRLFDPRDEGHIRASLDQLDTDGALRGREWTVLTGAGRTLEVEVDARLEHDAHGAVVASRWSLRDVTALKAERAARVDAEMQARLQQAQKLESLGVLAGGIAHDFNNLLVGVLGNIELAEMSLPPLHPAREHLDRALRASERAADLCRQMLAYSGKGRFQVHPIDVSALVREMAELLSVSVPKHVTLRCDLVDGLPPVLADASQLRQVVMNLITNGAEAIVAQSGIVAVRTTSLYADAGYLRSLGSVDELAEGRYVCIEVSDTGQGMDAATQRRIFEPFFTTKFTGRGLGLAAVIGIVRGHKGALKVYSEPGRGTTMKVLLPVDLSAAPAPSPAPAANERSVAGVVLVVDDEEAVRVVAQNALRLAGLEVIVAEDGVDALEQFRRRPDVALVLLDLTLPRLDGEAVFRELRALRPEVRVILMSGYNEQEVVNRFAGKGLAGFLQKPWSPRRLIDAVSAELSGRRESGA